MEHEKNPIFWAKVHAERATDEWQQKNAYPAGYADMPKKQQAAIRRVCKVTPELAQQLRAVYSAMPQIAVAAADSIPGEYLICGWRPEDDEVAKEAIWLAEQMGGAYQDDRARFDKDWAAEQYEPDGVFSISADVLEITGKLERRKHKEDKKQ